MSDIWLILIFIVPIVLIVLLRVNAIFAYLALCLGYVLSQFVVNTKIVSKIPDYNKLNKLSTNSNIHLALLLLPLVLIIFTMFKTAHKKKILSLNLVGAIAVGALAVITVVPKLPINTAISIVSSSIWVNISNYEGLVVAVTGVFILLLLISQRSKLKPQPKEGKHHKSKG